MTSSAEESNTKIEKIMSSNVVSLDITKTAAHAADLMTEKGVGSVIVTKNSKAFGIVTERDLVRRYSRGTLLESLASHPIITVEPTTTAEKVVEIMLKNKIRKLPIVDVNEAWNNNSNGPSYVPLAYKEIRFNILNTTNSLKRERTKV